MLVKLKVRSDCLIHNLLPTFLPGFRIPSSGGNAALVPQCERLNALIHYRVGNKRECNMCNIPVCVT